MRVPKAFLEDLARECGRSPAEVWQQLGRAKAAAPRTRKTWRIPVEGWEAFLARRHSFRL